MARLSTYIHVYTYWRLLRSAAGLLVFRLPADLGLQLTERVYIASDTLLRPLSHFFSPRPRPAFLDRVCLCTYTYVNARGGRCCVTISRAAPKWNRKLISLSRERDNVTRDRERERGRHFSDGRLRGYCPFVTCSLSYSGDRWLEGFFYRFGFLWRVYRRWLGNGRDVVLDAFKKLSVWTETRLFGIIFISKKVRNIKICFEECIFHMLKNFFFCAWKFLLPACIRRNGLF